MNDREITGLLIAAAVIASFGMGALMERWRLQRELDSRVWFLPTESGGYYYGPGKWTQNKDIARSTVIPWTFTPASP